MIRQSRSFVRTVLAIVLATVMLGACDWTHVGFGPGRTNFNPSEPRLTPSTVSELRQRWTISVPGVSSQQPLTANGLVYFAMPGSRLAAVNATTGAPAWSITIDVTSIFAVADGKVYATTQQGLSAFDARTGVEIWSITIGRPVEWSFPASSAGPAVANGLVYVVGLDSRLHAYDAATGALDWSVAPTSRTLGAGAVVANGVAYVAATDWAAGPNVFALNAITGATLWSATTEVPGAFVSMADNARAYVMSFFCFLGQCGTSIHAFDATDGSVDWTASVGGSWHPLAVGGGIMYSYPFDAIDSATGAVLWRHDLPSYAAAIAHGVIYSAEERTLRARDAATGTELWSSPTLAEGVFGWPSVANGTLYVVAGTSLVAFGL